MSFNSISGQPQAVNVLRGALEKRHLPHAMLFTGPTGCGQRELAFELVKALFCQRPTAAGGCDVCLSCRQVMARSHPDFMVLEPENGVIKIEHVRGLIGRASLSPLEAPAKVFLILRAECMNDVAQNALLKTLEEPAGRTHFVLVSSSAQGLLLTIRSRCQTVHFQPVGIQSETDEQIEALKKRTLDFVLNAGQRASPQAPELGGVERESVAAVLDYLVEFFRRCLLRKIKAGKILQASEGVFGDEALANPFEAEDLDWLIEALSEAKERVLNKVNTRLVLSVLWSQVAALNRKMAVKQ